MFGLHFQWWDFVRLDIVCHIYLSHASYKWRMYAKDYMQPMPALPEAGSVRLCAVLYSVDILHFDRVHRLLYPGALIAVPT